MFWTRKPPLTKAEQAKQAAISAAQSLADRASELSGTLSAHAHNVLDAVPTETVAQKWDDLRLAAVERVTEAEKLVADKWAATRPVVEEKAHIAAQATNDAAHSAQEALRQNKKKAEAELAETQKELAKRRKELDKQLHAQAKEFAKQKEALSAQHEEWKQSLVDEAQRVQAETQKTLKQHAKEAEAAKKRAAAEAQHALEVAKSKADHTKIVVDHDVNLDDILPYAHNGETDIEIRESGGTSIWLWLGVGLIVGAVAIYFLAPGSGRRSRAAIKDRLGKVKDDLVDGTTKKNDATAERIEAITGRAENKLAEVADAVATKVEDVAHSLSSKVESAGEGLAQGIETAGASASDAASTVANKVDDAKQTLTDRLEPAAKDSGELPVVPSDATAATEIVITPQPASESVTDVVKEAEQTVESIEASVRRKKAKNSD